MSASIINPDLEVESYSKELSLTGRVQIHNFLLPNVAEDLYQCLLTQTPWELAFYEGGKGRKLMPDERKLLPDAELEAIIEKVKSCDADDYQFLYESYMIVTAYLERRNPELLLHRFLEWINDESFKQYFRHLTKSATISKIDAQATRYLPGYFLREHNDFDADKGRLFAYVLNLTKSWKPDWGGLLHFTSEKKVTQTMVPQFNTLNIFTVPQNHFVSNVSRFAGSERLSITGWMFNK